jgi:serine protease Do
MRMLTLAALLAAVLAVPAHPADDPAAESPLPDREALASVRRTAQTFRAVAQKVRPAVVHLRSRLPRTAGELARDEPEEEANGDGGVPYSVGSGVIIDREGFILTSYHVVRNAVEIHARLKDRRELRAELISFDPVSDLAMLRVESETPLPFADLGDSAAVEVGDWVLAIGSPGGLHQTVTHGIISATGRDFLTDEDNSFFGFQNFIQTDVRVYEGSSGGPLLNLNGQIVGITHNLVQSLRYDRQRQQAVMQPYEGLTFATPINLVKNVLQSMKQGRGAPRPRLGVGLRDVDEKIARAAGLERIRGAQVQHVEKESPAEGGLQTGDIILAFEGTPVRNRVHLRSLVAGAELDTPATFRVLRGGETREVVCRLFGGPVFGVDQFLGIAVVNLNKVLADSLRLEKPQGVLIVSVRPDGPGKRAGLKPGMVVAAVNAVPTPDISVYRKLIRRVGESPVIRLVVIVQGKMGFVQLRRDEEGRLVPMPTDAPEGEEVAPDLPPEAVVPAPAPAPEDGAPEPAAPDLPPLER